MAKRVVCEVMIIFVVSTLIYKLTCGGGIPMLLFWNVFAYMVIEDYKYEEIDLRSVILLVLFSVSGAEEIKSCIVGMLIGLAFFRVMYVATTRIYDREEMIKVRERRSGHGYLPSLGVSLIIYFALEKILKKPPEFIEILHQSFVEMLGFIRQVDEVLAVVIILWVMLWVVLEWRVRSAEKAHKKIIYGYGVGDIMVLGIMGGVLGEKIAAVFFISLLAQLAEYATENIVMGGKEIEH